jgi:hypothetical protein
MALRLCEPEPEFEPLSRTELFGQRAAAALEM